MRMEFCFRWSSPAFAVLLCHLAACTASRQPVSGSADSLSSSPSITVPKNRWTPDQQAVHVLNRLAYGPSASDLEAIRQIGPAAWIERQLHPDWIPDDAVTAKLRGFPTIVQSTSELLAAFPPLQVQARLAGINPANSDAREIIEAISKEDLPRQIGVELIGAKLVRAVESKRQLQEVLVDFWFNHFNVSVDKGQVKWMATSYERDAIRPHLFGTFRALLGATAHHPAMLFYLDNWLSTRESIDARDLKKGQPPPKKIEGRGLNENYARELLELHTLGVNGGYTQQDVRETARCFTGWSIDAPRYFGDFLYRDMAHDKGQKAVLGMTIPPGGGQEDGERVLDLLANHPSTARFIATKLVRKFVSDDPPSALVEHVADVFLKTHGHLPSVYAAIFSSPEFWSDQAFASKTKTPLEFAVSAVRALGGTTNGDVALAQAMAPMGQPLYRSQPPTGFPETAESWINAGALVNRINFGLALAANRIRGTTVDVARYVTPAAAKDPAAELDTLAPIILGRSLSAASRRTLLGGLAEVSGDTAHGERHPVDPKMVAGLLLGSPEFQKQ